MKIREGEGGDEPRFVRPSNNISLVTPTYLSSSILQLYLALHI